ncbi:MAG: hypothetical protein WDN76_06590 [Alphaproteobacteria bacterium]
MGGATAASRDAQVAALIESAYQQLATRKSGVSGVLVASTDNAATLTSMPINRVSLDANGTVKSELTRSDQASYTSGVPTVAKAIAGAAAAAASVIAPDASAATPRAGAPLKAGGGQRDRHDRPLLGRGGDPQIRQFECKQEFAKF